jgi:tripartite-type tricarboxylate transporter receptor subunit TctC
MNRRELLMAAAGLAVLPGPAGFAALAQGTYPNRPIRLIVPFPPGGVNDVVARLWAEKARPLLGTLVIENRGGAGGVIGAAEAARAQPDGYTLLLGSSGTQIINPAVMNRPPYDPQKDFTAVTILAGTATSIAVHPSLPVHSLKDLVDHAKANPGRLSYGSAGAGTMTHLSGELFKQLAGGLDMLHVPYKGTGPGLTDLMSGNVPVFMPNITGQVLALHQTGKIRILAVASPTRIKAAPDLPTAIEAGLDGMVGITFSGLFAPAGTPGEIIQRIHSAARQALADPELQAAMLNSGSEPIGEISPADAQRFVQEEHGRWAPVIKASGFRLD